MNLLAKVDTCMCFKRVCFLEKMQATSMSSKIRTCAGFAWCSKIVDYNGESEGQNTLCLFDDKHARIPPPTHTPHTQGDEAPPKWFIVMNSNGKSPHDLEVIMYVCMYVFMSVFLSHMHPCPLTPMGQERK